MNRVEALKVALNALYAQQADAEYNLKIDHSSADTRQFWLDRITEIKAAYIELTKALGETDTQQGEARA